MNFERLFPRKKILIPNFFGDISLHNWKKIFFGEIYIIEFFIFLVWKNIDTVTNRFKNLLTGELIYRTIDKFFILRLKFWIDDFKNIFSKNNLSAFFSQFINNFVKRNHLMF